MRYLTLIVYIALQSVCVAKDSLQIKLLEPLPLNGQEHIIKSETTFEGQKVQVVGKGKGEYSRQAGGIITNVAVSHVVLPGKTPKLSALKKPYLTSFKTKFASKTASFNQGKTLTVNVDSQDLRQVLEKGKRGEISEAVTTVAEHATSSDRQVDLVDDSLNSSLSALNQTSKGGRKLKGKSRTSNYPMHAGEGENYAAAEKGSENAEAGLEKGRARGSNESSGQGRAFSSGRGSGWAGIPTGQGALRERRANDSESAKRTPTITTESTDEGCSPTIDKLHHRVIIQKRVIAKTDGRVTNPGKCEDTLENYPIERDYRCEGCRGLVHEADKVVYPQYRSYWIKHTGEKVYIDQTPQLDRENSYGFIEETDACPPDIDFGRGVAFPQMRLVYLDRWNTKHEIRPCARIGGHGGYPLEWTKEGCSLLHEFNNNRSKETHRAVFKVGSSVHEAKKCEATGPWLNHQFVKAQCRPILDIDGGLITATARRQITTAQGPQLITQECEPRETANLQQTREGCEAKYFHDWQAGKSYFKKRYYYTAEGGRKFVSPCLRTAEFVNHIIDQTRFQNDDRLKVSRPLIEISIEGPEGRALIFPKQLRDTLPIPYVLLREEEKINMRNPEYKGAFKTFLSDKINVWKRADESLFEEVIGIGENSLSIEAEHRIEVEKRTIPVRTDMAVYSSAILTGNGVVQGQVGYRFTQTFASGPNLGRVGRGPQIDDSPGYTLFKTFYADQEREVKIYDNGHRENGEWITIRETSKS